MVFMIAGLAIFMACFSAITSAFDRVFEEAANPDVNPLEEFEVVRREQLEIHERHRETGTTEAEADSE